MFGQEKWSKNVQSFRIYHICHSTNNILDKSKGSRDIRQQTVRWCFEPWTKVVWSGSGPDTVILSDLNKQTITVLEDHSGKVVKVCEDTSVFGQEKWSKDVQSFRVYPTCHSTNNILDKSKGSRDIQQQKVRWCLSPGQR